MTRIPGVTALILSGRTAERDLSLQPIDYPQEEFNTILLEKYSKEAFLIYKLNQRKSVSKLQLASQVVRQIEPSVDTSTASSDTLNRILQRFSYLDADCRLDSLLSPFKHTMEDKLYFQPLDIRGLSKVEDSHGDLALFVLCVCSETVQLEKMSKVFFKGINDPSPSKGKRVFQEKNVVFNRISSSDDSSFILVVLVESTTKLTPKHGLENLKYKTRGFTVLPFLESAETCLNGIFELPLFPAELTLDLFLSVTDVTAWQFQHRLLTSLTPSLSVTVALGLPEYMDMFHSSKDRLDKELAPLVNNMFLPDSFIKRRKQEELVPSKKHQAVSIVGSNRISQGIETLSDQEREVLEYKIREYFKNLLSPSA